MASIRCASCTLRALRILARSAGAESPNSFQSTPFHPRSSRSFAISQDPFRRHTSSLAAQPVENPELVDATSQADEPLNSIPEDANDFVATRQDHQSTPLPPTNLVDKSEHRKNKNHKRKTERIGKQAIGAAEPDQNVEHIDQKPSAGKKSGKEKLRTSSRNARREAARRGLTYEEFQEQDPEHPANIRAKRGEIKKAEAQAPKEVNKTRWKQVSGGKTRPGQPKKREEWQIQKSALEEKFQEGWNPQKRLSPDALDGIRALHHQDPEKFSTDLLSQHFEVSPEAIRRILRSKWKPSGEEQDDRMRRWNKRGEKIWERYVELGVRPPKKWREMGVGKTIQGEAEAWKKHKRAVQVMLTESRLADEFERESESEALPEQSFADRIL